MNSMLDKLKENRTPILLAEIGAYLHDLGKARRDFIEHYSEESQKKGPDGHNFLSIFPQELITILNEIEVLICGEKVSLTDFIEKHHPEKEPDGKRKDCEIPPIVRLLYARTNGYDGMDSGLDKGNAQVKQKRDFTFISTAFGYEFKRIELSKINDLTNELQKSIMCALREFKSDGNIIKLRCSILNKTKEYYSYFLGETRRPANDITLWDHSYSVATLVKCAIAKNIIDFPNVSFDPLDFNWKIFSVNLDVLRLLTKGVKLGDILGYWKSIKEVFGKVKEIIEVKYPIGNEIYRDTTGIFFLVPDIELEELEKAILEKVENIEPELMPKIMIKEVAYSNYNIGDRKKIEDHKKEELKKSIPEARENALQEIAFPTSHTRFFYEKFSTDNLENSEFCPICRLRPMDENSDGCKYCLKRRKSRAEMWIKNPKYTIWVDEVSDHNDEIALIVGRFNLEKWLDGTFVGTFAINAGNSISIKPKNSSPARIRRCWDTTEKFIRSTIYKEILEMWEWKPDIRKQRIQFKIEPNPDIQEGSTCDIDVDGVRFSPVCIERKNGIFISTINLEILRKFGDSADRISRNLNEKEIRVKTERDKTWRSAKNGKSFKITEARIADEKYRNYLPFVKIYDFPDQFMVLVPAYEALDIAEKILNEYEMQFSKVRDRLSFHLGIIAFHRRTPLYVAMDAGRRLLETFNQRTQSVKAEVIEVADNKNEKTVELKIHAKNYASSPFKWEVSYSTGDPGQEDLWHPYVRFKNSNPGRKLSFDYTGSGDFVVHIKEVRPGDVIEIEPSYFKLLYLENAADRFIVGDDLRPLHDIRRLQELWKEVRSRLESKTWSMSQIYAFREELKRRRAYKSDEFERFVKTDLINVLDIYPQRDKELFDKFVQAVKDDLLDLCLHWNLQVRKEK